MLRLIQFKLYVHPNLFFNYLTEIKKQERLPIQDNESGVGEKEVEDEGMNKYITQEASTGSFKTVPSADELAENMSQ